jgi:curved DNA-binding protein CbpA
MSVDRDAYVVLHVQPGASAEVISAVYRRLARRYHPDGPTPDAARMTDLNRAYNEVKTSELRRRYDEAHGLAAVGPGRPASPPPAPAARAPGVRPSPVGTPAEAPSPVPSSGARGPVASAPLRERIRAAREGVIDFGRYTGWTIAELARHDPDYLRWLSRHSAGVRFVDAIARYLPGDREVGRRAADILA